MIYKEDIERAIAQKKSNKKLVQRLKNLNPSTLDAQFHEQHDAVFEDIDCLSCANCCKTTSPIFRDIDISRLSNHLRLSVSAFINLYLVLDGEGDYVLKSSPCPFLLEDNKCEVYESRPLACKEYPHTNRKKMHQILSLTRKNTEICPAVSRMFTNLKSSL